MLTILLLQLFRKDLISAMKLPDNEPLEAEDYWTVTDTWKQEWERGVQVEDKHKIYKIPSRPWCAMRRNTSGGIHSSWPVVII